MIGIGTNVLVRYLAQDDEIQNIKAVELINQYSGITSSIFINNVVICELIWVLERGYKYTKKQVIEVLKNVLTTVEFSFEDHNILWMSSIEYEQSSADFADALIGRLNISNACTKTFTFDKQASNLQHFSIIDSSKKTTNI